MTTIPDRDPKAAGQCSATSRWGSCRDPHNADTERWTCARIEALRLIAAQFDGQAGPVSLEDLDAVLSALSELAGVFLLRRFEAEGGTQSSARRWLTFAINTEMANLAEVAGKQQP